MTGLDVAGPVKAVEVCSGKAWVGTARLGGLGVFWCGEIRRFWRVTVRYGEAWQGGAVELS